jgi:hypothetical protein
LSTKILVSRRSDARGAIQETEKIFKDAKKKLDKKGAVLYNGDEK